VTDRAHRAGAGRDDDGRPGTGLAAAGLAAGGWLLLLVTAPVAIFLTWWGDCFEEVCPSASELDRAAYTLDFAAILIVPALAFGAYRGWRPAAVALIVAGLIVVGQVVASALGARGFQAFPLVLPAGALLVAAGIVALRPGSLGAVADGAAATTRRGLVGLGVLSVVIVAIAFQGVMSGAGGIGGVILVLMAVALTFIALMALRNRGAPQPPDRQPATRRRR
jgi:hypothetical protein